MFSGSLAYASGYDCGASPDAISRHASGYYFDSIHDLDAHTLWVGTHEAVVAPLATATCTRETNWAGVRECFRT
jgi:hypothetical protein